MKVLILDDNSIDIKNLEKNLNIYSKKYKINMQIDTCEKETDIIDIVNNYDLIFIDIELESLNGIDIAIDIRKCNTDIKIIFVSKHSKYLERGYKAHADRYFLKPIDQLEFELEMEDIIKDYKYNHMGFYDKKIYCKKIYYKHILYIEFLQRKTYIHLLSGKVIETPLSLKEWLLKLEDYNFCRIHKSFIVNIYNIEEYNKTSIKLKNDEIIPLSRVYYNDFEKAFIAQIHLHI